MDTVIIVTFRVNGLPAPIKIASKTEPSIKQIFKMIVDLVNRNNMSGDIQFKKFLQENEHKMYIYEIGQQKCVVLVEKLAKIKEFEN